MPLGIKDIIETADMPTENGSPLFAGWRSERDAASVAALRESGAVIVGKTVTTEFAATEPRGKREWFGSPLAKRFPLHLMSNQPRTRLHSQLDYGVTSRESKIHGREPMRMNPLDAEQRRIRDGDVVRVFNDRGEFLAGVRLSDALRRGVVQISTGAWYDILDPADRKSLEIHGNPNAVTNDIGTSSLAQGPSANSCLVEAERYEGNLPPVKVFSLPAIIER
jgi:biotin/methionine sulfoxide reductase